MGRVGKPHGLRGEVYVDRISDDPRRFAPGAVLLHEDGRRLTVAAARPHRERFLVSFEDVGTRDAAERLRGSLYVSSRELRSLEEGEYWPHDLVGCSVLTTNGSEVGRIEGVIDAPAQDLLVVSTPAGERFVPMVRELVVEVDLQRRRVIVSPPEGLFD